MEHCRSPIVRARRARARCGGLRRGARPPAASPYQFVEKLADPKGFEPSTSAFGGTRAIRNLSLSAKFRRKRARNAAKTSRDYADILRTPADRIGGAAHVVGMMMSIGSD